MAEVLDELFELVKFEEKRGSGATSKTEDQWSVVYRINNRKL